MGTKRFHDEWCDLRHGGIECNCTYYDQPCDGEYKARIDGEASLKGDE